MMPDIKAVIYDCDGVLIDSLRANEAFYNQILRHFGLPDITPEQLAQAQVLTSQAAIDLLFSGTPWRQEAQAYQQTVDNTPFIPLIKPEPHIEETLKRLRPVYHTAIATNRGRSLPQVLNHVGLTDLFDLTISSLDIKRPKPHPESLRVILEHFRISPEEALYIGDAEVDQQVAAFAGVPFMAYKNPSLDAIFHLQNHLELFQVLPELKIRSESGLELA
jgi:HAD superfamily hydrolase (TIGR01509 family)